MLTLRIIRGLPGSGKSTLAKKLAAETPFTEHYEADMYFINADGDYKFDGSRIGAAHEWCYRQVESALYSGNSVIVSNTFTTIMELEDYLNLAERVGVQLIITECLSNFGSIHSVPEKSMQRMRSRWVPNSKIFMPTTTHLLHQPLNCVMETVE